jgi:hypothetical protein
VHGGRRRQEHKVLPRHESGCRGEHDQPWAARRDPDGQQHRPENGQHVIKDEHAEPDRVGVQEEEQRNPCGSAVVAQHPAGKPMDGQDAEEGDDQGQHAQTRQLEPHQPTPPRVQRERERRGQFARIPPERLKAHVLAEPLDRLEVVLLVPPGRAIKSGDRHDAEPARGHRRDEQGALGRPVDGHRRPHGIRTPGPDCASGDGSSVGPRRGSKKFSTTTVCSGERETTNGASAYCVGKYCSAASIRSER